MRLAVGLIAAVTLTAAAAVPASAAAPKKKTPTPKVCNLVSDKAGDATPSPAAFPNDDSVDIVGGDFASNGSKLTGIIKLKGFTAQNPRALGGQSYFLIFNVKGIADTLTLSAGFYPTGTEFSYGYEAIDSRGVTTSYTLGAAVGEVKGNDIHITAEIAKFPQKNFLKNGNRLTALTAQARYVLGQRVVPSQDVQGTRVPLGGATMRFDEAIGKPYVLGAPSCVTVR